MTLFKLNNLGEFDLGAILSTKDMGITLKEPNNNSDLPIKFRYSEIEENKTYPLHVHDYGETIIVFSGNACLECNKQNYYLESGDLVYIFPGEIHSITNIGEGQLKTISFYTK